MKILTAYRKRRKTDEKLSARLFQLYVDANQSEDAWNELDALAKLAASNPE